MAFVRLGRRLHTLSFLRPGHLSLILFLLLLQTLSLSLTAQLRKEIFILLFLSLRDSTLFVDRFYFFLFMLFCAVYVRDRTLVTVSYIKYYA